MVKNSILNPDYFKILDDNINKISYGCNQEWYTTVWQRLSGCGPSVASNIILYLSYNGQTFELGQDYSNIRNCLLLMEELWKHVTPTMRGVNTTKIFYEGMLSYAKLKELNIKYEFIDIPKDKYSRPEIGNVLKFLEISLQKNSPVAFLNLCNGKEKYLDKWHWVTIISLEYSEDGSSAYIEIMDEGIIKKIDLLLWYNTTTLGGGFVYFTVNTSL